MPEILSIIPTLRVASIDVAMPFYEALGFGVSWQHQIGPDAPRLACVAQGPGQLFLTEHAVAPFASVVHLMVTGLDDVLDRARQKGVEPTFGPEVRPWGDREAYFTDPDGNVLRCGETVSGPMDTTHS
jgi:catechol 2,3-dioxygenase-like lactoylglutathione lyase family enzyme